jgi:hypothetical protein
MLVFHSCYNTLYTPTLYTCMILTIIICIRSNKITRSHIRPNKFEPDLEVQGEQIQVKEQTNVVLDQGKLRFIPLKSLTFTLN